MAPLAWLRSRRTSEATGGPANGQAPEPEPPRSLPSWMFPAGLAVFVVLAGAYWQLVDGSGDQPHWYGMDLDVYRQAGLAARGDDPVYEFRTDQNLPFTYPPITLVPFSLLSLLERNDALLLVNLASIACIVPVAWLTLGMLGYRRSIGRFGAALAVGGLMCWSEPLTNGLGQGQINVFLMLIIVADLALPDDRRFKGLGVGLATACKLTPALFIVYLLITRRVRAGLVATGGFLACTLAGFALYPADSREYWSGTFLDSNRVTAITAGPGYVGNQSVHGFMVRLAEGTRLGDPLWIAGAIAVSALGLAVAAAAHRRRLEAYGMTACAATMLLISPISWSHHWVWIAPLFLVLADAVRRSPEEMKALTALMPAALAVVMFAWPLHFGLPIGMLWELPHFENREYGWTLWQAVRGEAYTVVTVAVLAVAAAVWRIGRAGRRDQRAAPLVTR